MYDIILLKMTGCHFCDKFIEIYNKAIELNENKSIKFQDFDMSKNDEKEIFEDKFNDVSKINIDGYPTVFLKDGKNIKEIETVIDDDIILGAKKFLKNIKDNIKCESNEEYDELNLKYSKLLEEYETMKHKYKKYKLKYANKKNKK